MVININLKRELARTHQSIGKKPSVVLRAITKCSVVIDFLCSNFNVSKVFSLKHVCKYHLHDQGTDHRQARIMTDNPG